MFSRLLNRVVETFDDTGWEDAPAVEMPAAFSDLLPYRVYDKTTEMYINKSSLGMAIECAPLLAADPNVVSMVQNTMSGIQAGITLQFTTFASPYFGSNLDSWVLARDAVGGIYPELGLGRRSMMRGAGWRSLTNNAVFLARNYRVFIFVSIVMRDTRDASTLSDVTSRIINLLNTIGVPSRRLGYVQLMSVVNDMFFPHYDIYSKQRTFSEMDPLNHQAGTYGRAVEPTKDRIRLGDGFSARVLSAQKWPRVWGLWQMQSLLGDPLSDYLRPKTPWVATHTIHYQDPIKMTRKAQMRAARTLKQANSNMAMFVPELKEHAKEARFVGMKINEGEVAVESFHTVVVLGEDSMLDEGSDAMQNLYKSVGWELEKEQFIQLPAFMMNVPFAPSEGLITDIRNMGRLRTHLSNTSSNMLPIIGDWKGMNSPCMQLISRNGEVFFWDPFENKGGNYNCCVVGKSGSGKSVFMQDMVAGICGNGGHCVVVDDGYSFFNSCLLQDGQHMTFSADKAVSINPFSLIDEMSFQFDKEYASSCISMINAMVRQAVRQKGITDDVEDSLIALAVGAVWDTHARKGTFSEVADFLRSYKDENNQPDQRAADLALSLQPYCRSGQFGSYFSGECQLSIDTHLVVFELSEIKTRPELRSQVLLIIMFLASNKMYSSGRKRNTAVFMDEAWDLLSGEGSKVFIEGMARRARKYRGAIITGTQSVNDYYANPAAQATLENSDWMVMLAQKDESIEKLKTSGNMVVNDDLAKALRSLRMVDFQYSECLIKGNDFYAIGRLLVDPFSIVLYSSKGEDVNKIKELQDSGLALHDALLKYASMQAQKRGIDLKMQMDTSRAELNLIRERTV